MSCVTCHVSFVPCHMSTFTCHMSPITCHFLYFLLDKVVELVVEVSVINGAYPAFLFKRLTFSKVPFEKVDLDKSMTEFLNVASSQTFHDLAQDFVFSVQKMIIYVFIKLFFNEISFYISVWYFCRC